MLIADMTKLIYKDIDNILCIYPTVGKAMYSEVRERLALRIANSIAGALLEEQIKREEDEECPN